ALLVPIVATIGTSFTAFNLLGCLFGAASVLLLYLFQKERTGAWAALLPAIVLWVDPGFWTQCNRVMSDVPGLALLLAALLLERRAARSGSWGSEVALGALVGVSAYVRWANILLVPCIAAARLLRRLATSGDGKSAEGDPWIRFTLRRLLPF